MCYQLRSGGMLIGRIAVSGTFTSRQGLPPRDFVRHPPQPPAPRVGAGRKIFSPPVCAGRQPEQRGGTIGNNYALDMLIGESLDIHIEARLARVTDSQLGFA